MWKGTSNALKEVKLGVNFVTLGVLNFQCETNMSAQGLILLSWRYSDCLSPIISRRWWNVSENCYIAYLKPQRIGLDFKGKCYIHITDSSSTFYTWRDRTLSSGYSILLPGTEENFQNTSSYWRILVTLFPSTYIFVAE